MKAAANVNFHFTFVTLRFNPRTMKFKIFCLLFGAVLLVSCQHDEEKRLTEQKKDAQKKELIFNNINKGWNFNTPPLNPKAQVLVNNWTELRMFVSELNQKPKSSIGAFQKKAKVLSTKAADLNKNIPFTFNKPEVKARIAVIMTKMNSINLFINLQEIPDQKIIALIADSNLEIASLYSQMNEIVRKSEIPKEEGESDMIRILDTARAIPTKPVTNPGQPDPKIFPKR